MGKYNYDALGNRVRFREFGLKDGMPFQNDRLMLFEEGVSYEINWPFGCKKRALETSFQPMQVPSNATFMGQVIVGSSSMPLQGLLVNNWVGELPEMQAKYMASFTAIGCLPLSTIYYTNETGYMSISFHNIVHGIDNPQVFFPPAICKHAELKGKTDFFGAFL
ncbi:hypothetical protein AAFF_G00197310 [Aldrovandia affinis]|uniref:Ependymin-like n=1 Tax=Aldrovandia affinis TaxID=143900 RepID=A0AAD7RIF0_9TELE|nr:hypothetical protein AAFF_G00197310 [Aldrovandia affinis]